MKLYDLYNVIPIYEKKCQLVNQYNIPINQQPKFSDFFKNLCITFVKTTTQPTILHICINDYILEQKQFNQVGHHNMVCNFSTITYPFITHPKLYIKFNNTSNDPLFYNVQFNKISMPIFMPMAIDIYMPYINHQSEDFNIIQFMPNQYVHFGYTKIIGNFLYAIDDILLIRCNNIIPLQYQILPPIPELYLMIMEKYGIHLKSRDYYLCIKSNELKCIPFDQNSNQFEIIKNPVHIKNIIEEAYQTVKLLISILAYRSKSILK